jgi:hypothetical protein
MELDRKKVCGAGTPLKRLREMDLEFEGQGRELEQNPNTDSRWA